MESPSESVQQESSNNTTLRMFESNLGQVDFVYATDPHQHIADCGS